MPDDCAAASETSAPSSAAAVLPALHLHIIQNILNKIAGLQIRIRLNPDSDLHTSEKLDTDPHQSKKFRTAEAHNGSVWSQNGAGT
jgi:hypothetical protein